MKQIISIIAQMLIVFSLQSCRIFGYTESPNELFVEILNKKNELSDTRLLLNGVYTLTLYYSSSQIIDSIHNVNGAGFISPLIFYGNNLVSETGLSFHSEEWLTHLFLDEKEFMSNKPWGVYENENGFVKAIIYVSFRGNSHNWDNRYLCYFEGRMEGREKIVDWHIVPPFPDLTKRELKYKYNQQILAYLKALKTYEYRLFPMKTNIDSTKVWINKYRQHSTLN
jgi:hypothetical protein